MVISAGSLGSPGILERSGIGAKDVLEGVGVKQRVDLPGVGENYQGPPNDTSSVTGKVADDSLRCADHNVMGTSYLVADEAETLDAIYRNDVDAIAGLSPLQVS